MGFLSNLFQTDPATLETKGDAEASAKNYVGALSYYQRAASAKANDGILNKIVAMKDALATQKLEEATQLITQGDLELAWTDLDGALDIAASEGLRIRIQKKILELQEQDEANFLSQEIPELHPEDQYRMLAQHYSPAQLEEYDVYGEPFRQALIGLASGKPDAIASSKRTISALRSQHPEGLFLQYIDGIACLRSGDNTQGKHDLETFLTRLDASSLKDTDTSLPRSRANLELAFLYDQNGDETAAIERLTAVVEAFPENPHALSTLGSYLRSKGHTDEAIEVLDASLKLHESLASFADPHLIMELGVAMHDAKRHTEAVDLLERALLIWMQRGERLVHPDLGAALASSCTELGAHNRAAEIHILLAKSTPKKDSVPHLEHAKASFERAGLSALAHKCNEQIENLSRSSATLGE